MAERAGVSTSTASLAFSGRGPVAPDTAARIRGAAAELGYAGPDPLAASLRRGRTGTVAVIIDDRLLYAFRDPFAVGVLDGLAQVLDTVGSGMLLLSNPADDPDRLAGQLSALALDAAVFPLCTPPTSPAFTALRARGIPVVTTVGPPRPGVVTLTFDERDAQRRLGRHLHDLGHRHVAHVTLALEPGIATGLVEPAIVDTSQLTEARDRAAGFADVFGARHPLVVPRRSDADGGYAAGRLLLDVPADRRPSAVIVQSDLLAAGVIRAAEDLGLRVPQDLSVTGFDGISLPWLEHTLTTVDQHAGDKGRALGHLVRSLLDRLPTTSAEHRVTVRLGTTTAPPP